MNGVLKWLLYGFDLGRMSNRKLMDEVFDHIYGGLAMNSRECAIWDEVLYRLEHTQEHRQMREELTAGILPQDNSNTKQGAS